MTTQLIEITKLVKSPLNVRRTVSKAACEELKASILAHGLMQNLVVVPANKGKYHVIAGARRLEALQSLQVDGKLPADYAAPCQIVTDEHAAEMSLAENTIRHAMHPADEFEAFAALVDQGQTAAQIAQRFGKPEKHVLQRLKLGRVAPELLAEYRAEEITLEALEAFTITDDQKRQMKVWKGLQGWQKGNASAIRSALTEQMTEGDDKLAEFVGLEAYQAAGGRVKSDLFGDDVYLEDTALLQRLAGEKLGAEAEKLRAEGWGWVEVNFELGYGTLSTFGRIKPTPLDAPAELVAELEAAEAEQTHIAGLIDEAYGEDEEDETLLEGLEAQTEAVEERIEQIEAKLASFIDFDPEQKQLAGCFVSVSYGGKLTIEKGLVKPEDKKKNAKAQTTGEVEKSETGKPALSQSLVNDLKAYRLAAAQTEIAKHPAIAFDLLVFQAAKAVCSISHAYDGPQVTFQCQSGGAASSDARGFVTEQMNAIEKTLPLDWQELDNEGDQFATFQKLSNEKKHALLAFCVARTLQPKLGTDNEYPSAYDTALSQTGASVADYWRPTAANFLSRITTGQLLEIGAELFGQAWSTQRRNAKKAALVAELDKAFSQPEKALDPEKVRTIAAWLPEGMAFGPVEAPAKQRKNAA